MRRLVITFAILGLAISAIPFVLADVVPPHAMTVTAIDETSVRIGLYFDWHGRLPTDLNMLPIRQGYANRSTDGWKRALNYTVNGDAKFTLSSLGRDGRIGGTGDDADISKHYMIANGEVRESP